MSKRAFIQRDFLLRKICWIKSNFLAMCDYCVTPAQHSPAQPPLAVLLFDKETFRNMFYWAVGGHWPSHCFISFLCQPGNVFYQERQIVRYHLKATQRPHQTGPEINGGGAPWLWPPCLARLYFVKIFHQMRNISHTNQTHRRQSWLGGWWMVMLILWYCTVPSHYAINFAYKSGKLIVSHWKVIYEYVMANRW